MKISVIIPALNEEANLPFAVRSVGCGHEVILADGGSTDRTVKIAEKLGLKTIISGTGRGSQMDGAALRATGDILLFLHADSILPQGWERKVRETMREGFIAGGFNLRIGSDKDRFRLAEKVISFRSRRLGLIYGDQAIFARKDIFFRAGGFRKLPLMEDIDCVKRLRGQGKVALISDEVITSSRRWEQGFLRNTFKNWFFLALYFAGVSPQRLYRWYYKKVK